MKKALLLGALGVGLAIVGVTTAKVVANGMVMSALEDHKTEMSLKEAKADKATYSFLEGSVSYEGLHLEDNEGQIISLEKLVIHDADREGFNQGKPGYLNAEFEGLAISSVEGDALPEGVTMDGVIDFDTRDGNADVDIETSFNTKDENTFARMNLRVELLGVERDIVSLKSAEAKFTTHDPSVLFSPGEREELVMMLAMFTMTLNSSPELVELLDPISKSLETEFPHCLTIGLYPEKPVELMESKIREAASTDPLRLIDLFKPKTSFELLKND